MTIIQTWSNKTDYILEPYEVHFIKLLHDQESILNLLTPPIEYLVNIVLMDNSNFVENDSLAVWFVLLAFSLLDIKAHM